jgi:hypothetical protein
VARFKEEPDAFVTPLVTRSMSAKIGLLEGFSLAEREIAETG